MTQEARAGKGVSRRSAATGRDMGRTAVWTAIRDTLEAEIGQGRYGPGDRLPTEAELAARFGVNRHTVRRAVAALAGAGLLRSRRGAGVFVAERPTSYPIGRRVRFHRNLAAAGHLPEKRHLLLTTRAADPREAAALAIAPGDPVHMAEGLSFSDRQPIALFRSVFPAGLLPRMLDRLRDDSSVTAALRSHGIDDYTRISTELSATLASPTQALHLQLRPGAAILRSVGVNADPGGRPVEYGRTWFAGDRVTLTLPGDEA